MIRFGMNATGHIVHRFADCIKQVDGACLTAVSSRSEIRARAAALEFKVPHAYGSYEEMLSGGEIDAVYVATPHTFHHRDCMLALEHGKHVICEKPLTLTESEAKEIFAKAKEKGLFVMEAMWPRFLPIFLRAKKMIDGGAIGTPTYVDVSFCFRNSDNPRARITDKALAGGALYDVGVYCIEMASYLVGENPCICEGVAKLADSGVDENDVLAMGFPNGCVASARCGVEAQMDNRITVYGTRGKICFNEFPKPTEFEVFVSDSLTETVTLPEEYNFRGEITEAVRCIGAGMIETVIMPHEDTVACARIFDHFRQQWKL